jgi:exoribonuclease II
MTEHERRKDERQERSTQVNFELTFKNEAGHAVKQRCETLDISKSGLRVHLSCQLPVGFITELCIENNKGQLMLLYAEVRWCKQAGQDYECGFELLDAEHSDLAYWVEQASV